MLRPIDPAGPQKTDQERLTTKDIQRQIAILIVVAVKWGEFLMPVQRHIGGVDVEDQLARCLRLGRDELLNQHPIQGHHIGTAGTGFQA